MFSSTQPRLIMPSTSCSEAGARCVGSNTTTITIGAPAMVSPSSRDASFGTRAGSSVRQLAGNCVPRMPTLRRASSSDDHDSWRKFSTMNVGDTGARIAPSSASTRGSSTTTRRKFCMLCAVGAQRAASTIAASSGSLTRCAGSNGWRDEHRASISQRMRSA